MGRLTAAMPVVVDPGPVVRRMSDRQLLDAVLRSPAQGKPCTRRGADRVEWQRPAVSRLADRRVAVREEMRARRLCAGCLVIGPCLELSLRGAPVEGVQGGTTERSRQTLRHRRAPQRGGGMCSGPAGDMPGQLPLPGRVFPQPLTSNRGDRHGTG